MGGPSKRTERTAKTIKTSIGLGEAKMPMPGASININLNISPEVSPQKLKEYIKAILEALQTTENKEAVSE